VVVVALPHTDLFGTLNTLSYKVQGPTRDAESQNTSASTQLLSGLGGLL